MLPASQEGSADRHREMLYTIKNIYLSVYMCVPCTHTYVCTDVCVHAGAEAIDGSQVSVDTAYQLICFRFASSFSNFCSFCRTGGKMVETGLGIVRIVNMWKTPKFRHPEICTSGISEENVFYSC